MKIISDLVKNAYLELEKLDKNSKEYQTSKRVLDAIKLFNTTHSINTSVNQFKDKIASFVDNFKNPVIQVEKIWMVSAESGYIVMTDIYLPSLSDKSRVYYYKETGKLSIDTSFVDEYVKQKFDISDILEVQIPNLSSNTDNELPIDSTINIKDGRITVKVFYKEKNIIDKTLNRLGTFFNKL